MNAAIPSPPLNTSNPGPFRVLKVQDSNGQEIAADVGNLASLYVPNFVRTTTVRDVKRCKMSTNFASPKL